MPISLPDSKQKLIVELDSETMTSVRNLPTDAADDAGRRERVENTYVETVRQPEAIEETLNVTSQAVEQLAAVLSRRNVKKIYFVGCGDSWFVGIGVRLLFERLIGAPSEAIQSLEYGHYYYGPTDEDTLVIGITSGGNTPRTIEAMVQARLAGAFTIGVTNSPDSTITRETDAHLLVAAERRGWPTQSSTSSIAALVHLAARWAGASNLSDRELRQQILTQLFAIPDQIRTILSRTNDSMKELAQRLHSAPVYLFAGGGPALSAASFGAAKVKELCPVHAITMPLEEYHHYRTQKPGDPLFLVAPPGPSTKRALDTLLESTRFGGISITLISDEDTELTAHADYAFRLPSINELLVAIPYSIPLHLFAYHLAAAKFAHNEGYPGLSK